MAVEVAVEGHGGRTGGDHADKNKNELNCNSFKQYKICYIVSQADCLFKFHCPVYNPAGELIPKKSNQRKRHCKNGVAEFSSDK